MTHTCPKPPYCPQCATDEIPVGTQFVNRHGRVCKVADIWRTYNLAGEIVAARYVCTHFFMGQVLTERDVLAVTIQRCIADPIPIEKAEKLARVRFPR